MTKYYIFDNILKKNTDDLQIYAGDNRRIIITKDYDYSLQKLCDRISRDNTPAYRINELYIRYKILKSYRYSNYEFVDFVLSKMNEELELELTEEDIMYIKLMSE